MLILYPVSGRGAVLQRPDYPRDGGVVRQLISIIRAKMMIEQGGEHFLLTGANGFVGQALCREAIARGVQVRGAV